MPNYQAPVEDWQFILHDFLRVQDQAQLPGFAELTPEFSEAVLGAAARFHEEVLFPLSLAGDAEGAHFEAGTVRTPRGYREAWDLYRKAGWHVLAVPAELGGAGLPQVLAAAITEMRTATGHSFSMYVSFCSSASRMLARLGAPWMQQHVVPRLVAGDWTATMCMTESHCGTDLRQIRTRAVQQADGSWRLSGTKIFISGGDHDLGENIAHIVLAKVPDADGNLPGGLSAVNVFLVTKRTVDPSSGALGGPNGVVVGSIEDKMGIEGNATCVLHFENAVAWRIASAASEGSSANMAAMFMLMNMARVNTAMSGIAYAEVCRQNATAYARERLSGRAPDGPRHPQLPADPLLVHPDVRRLLLGARSFAEGARATALRVALWQAEAEAEPDAARRADGEDLVDMLTPVMKAYFTDKGFESASGCLQVLGGHGYIREHGLEQWVRNARVGQIYEGANGIQALDFVMRKLRGNGGNALRVFCSRIEAFVTAHEEDANLRPFTLALAHALQLVRSTTESLLGQQQKNEVAAAGYDLLTAFGILAVAWTWAEVAAVLHAPERVSLSREARQRKLVLARLWFDRELPILAALCQRAGQGSAEMLALADDAI